MPVESDFIVTVDEEAVDLSSASPVTIRGRDVILGLVTAVTAGQVVKVSYTDPTPGDDSNAIQDPAGNDVATLTDESVRNRVGEQPMRQVITQSTQSHSSTPPSKTQTPRTSLKVAPTVPAGPHQVGQTFSYIVTVSNDGTESLTGVTWRDVTAEGAAQSVSDLSGGSSTSATGSFGPLQASRMPNFVLTVAADSDQTNEVCTSQPVQVVAASEGTTDSRQPPPQSDGQSGQPPRSDQLAGQPPQSDELSGQPPTGVRPRVPSSLVLRVVRNQFNVPDAHLAHNIPDLLVTLPDGTETSCNFLPHYENTGGLTRWGHTTSEVLEERPGSLTQYFQRGVLDCEERDGQWSVSRRLAWDYVGGGAAGAPDLGVEPDLFSDQAGDLVGPWNHQVSNYAVDGAYTGFLDFYTALGGVDTFGFPKTEARYDDDPRAELQILGASRRVIRQYFQSAVLEYHPSDTVQPVKLRLLGDDVRSRLYPNQAYKAFGSFGPSVPLAKGQIYTPERITPPGLADTTVAPLPGPPSATSPFATPREPPTATSPFVTPPEPSTLRLTVDRVLFSAPDVHLAHNIPDLTLTLADGSEASCDFLSYYESTYGVARWGHAISEVLEERAGSLTQYFQRGVLDCEQRDGEWRVDRRLAWDYIGGGVDGAPDLGVEPDLTSDQPGEPLGPWGHRVSNYAVDGTYIGFLDFFTALGGESTFGLPKTEARYDNHPRAALRVPNGDPGVIRQYFQAAVLEYHPDDVAQPVKLYLIGDSLRDWRYPSYGAFASFGSFGPLSEGQPYYPPATSSVLRPAG